MLQKLGHYYANVFKKFGVIVPAIIAILAVAVLVAFEVNDVFTAMKKSSEVLFLILLCVGCVAVVAFCALAFVKASAKEVGMMDVLILIGGIVAIGGLVMFIFNPGKHLLGILKWVVFGVILLASLVYGVVRSGKVD